MRTLIPDPILNTRARAVVPLLLSWCQVFEEQIEAKISVEQLEIFAESKFRDKADLADLRLLQVRDKGEGGEGGSPLRDAERSRRHTLTRLPFLLHSRYALRLTCAT